MFHLMEHRHIERIAGVVPGSYQKDPEGVYVQMLKNAGISVADQYLALNPLTMGNRGYTHDTERKATTGSREIFCDGCRIDSPEAVAGHLESVEFPRLIEAAAAFNEEERIAEITADELKKQRIMLPEITKTGYGFIQFPTLSYTTYGYENFFMAYALYPELMERHFSLQADLAVLNNQAAVKVFRNLDIPPLNRLDHDMADSRGTLVDITSLDRIWFPHFYRSILPCLDGGINLIWHCDGNLMKMLPRLLECGLQGFQGFQYEDGMDYPTICGMRTKEGRSPIIWAGVSVTRTLPLGSPDDVRKEVNFLVTHGPRVGLFLGTSSSVTPGVPWENIEMMLAGFRYYRETGRISIWSGE